MATNNAINSSIPIQISLGGTGSDTQEPNGVSYVSGSGNITSNDTFTYDGAGLLGLSHGVSDQTAFVLNNTSGVDSDAFIQINRNDNSSSGSTGSLRFGTYFPTADSWSIGLRNADINLYIHNDSFNTDAVIIDGATNSVSLTSDLIIKTVNTGIQVKGAAVSAGTANSAFVSNVVLTAGSSGTINNNFVTTACAGFASVSTSGGTPGLGYRVVCNSGSFSVTSTNVLDASTLNVFFIKGI